MSKYSKYILSGEEIRKRASEIIYPYTTAKTAIDAVIQLIEDATGEKLPELFYESKAVAGSVWASGNYTIVILNPDKATFFNANNVLDSSHFRNGTRAELIGALKDNSYKYLGMYDARAGLPK